MEKKGIIDWGVMNELKQGRELAEQLTNHLSATSSSSRRDFLLTQIVSCYENVISVLTSGMNTTTTTGSGFCIPVSSQDSKKRKTRVASACGWKEQVRVCSFEEHDGYYWRKYGQKDILGATFPRGYYRCSHRHTQGCLATKTVQKSDKNPTVFEVSYKGRHTCVQSCTANINYKPKQKTQELPIESGLKVDTQQQVHHICTEDDIFPSFSFPSEQPLGLDDIFAVDGDGFMGGHSPDFLSPATSGSNYFSAAETSAANSPIVDLDFSLDNLDCFFSANQYY